MEPKNKGGRPLAFKTKKELEVKIEEYFTYCDNRTKEVHSEKLGTMVMPDPEPYTMSGLAYALGVDRKTIVNYSHREEYFPTINKARAKVEADVERRLNDKNTFTPGLIFNAKNNFGWKDRQELDSTIHLPKPIMDIDVPEDDSNKEDQSANETN